MVHLKGSLVPLLGIYCGGDGGGSCSGVSVCWGVCVCGGGGGGGCYIGIPGID